MNASSRVVATRRRSIRADQPPEVAIHRFPRHVTAAATLLELGARGHERTETAPGFVLISADGRRQAGDQLWGRW